MVLYIPGGVENGHVATLNEVGDAVFERETRDVSFGYQEGR